MNILVLDSNLKGGDTLKRNASGYPEVYIEKGLTTGSLIEVVKQDGKISIVESKEVDNTDEEPLYTFITKEIGLYNGDKDSKLRSAVSLIVCDEYIVVTLFQGSIVFKPSAGEGEMVASRDAVDLPICKTDEINWVGVQDILSFITEKDCYGKYCDKYPFDYEYLVGISGAKKYNCTSFGMKKLKDSLDISGGVLAMKEVNDNLKEDMKKVKEMKNMFTQQNSGELEFDFDEDEEEDDEYCYE